MSFGSSFQDKLLMEQANLATKKLEKLNYLTDFISKHKVREAIKKARISSMTHKCPKCHELVWTTTREEVVSYIVLLRELCLDDEVKE